MAPATEAPTTPPCDVPQRRLADDAVLPVAVRSPADEREFSRRYPELAGRVAGRWLIPGLGAGYVPQGLTWVADSRCMLAALYCSRRERPSIIVGIDAADGHVRGVAELREPDGSAHVGHVGGLSVVGDAVFVTSGRRRSPLGRGLRFSLASVLRPQAGGAVADAELGFDARGSFMTAHEGKLWVGDFWRPTTRGDHPTASHHHQGPLRGWIAAHDVGQPGVTGGGATGKSSSDNMAPRRTIFIPPGVQGVAFVDDAIVLSRSWGSADSRLEIHRLGHRAWRPLELPSGRSIPTAALGETTLDELLEMPAGAQGLAWTGTHLLVSFEGGAMPYAERWRSDGAVIENSILGVRLPQR